MAPKDTSLSEVLEPATLTKLGKVLADMMEFKALKWGDCLALMG
jgi:hypothetical protein